MAPTPPPSKSNSPRTRTYHLVRTLRLTLPPPLTDNPDDLPRRDHAAIARVAALAPADAAEAELAAQFVAASEQWKDCLRLAQAPATSPEWAAKCRAQAASMMRQANAALRLLLRLQATRRKLDTDHQSADRGAWPAPCPDTATEHVATRLMAEALAALPAMPNATNPGSARPANPLAETPSAGEAPATPDLIRRGAASGHPESSGARSGDPGPRPAAAVAGQRAADPELIAGAERYAAAYPEQAAQIRRTGKLPRDVRFFDPPEAALASALIHANTPALAALDRDPPDPVPQNDPASRLARL